MEAGKPGQTGEGSRVCTPGKTGTRAGKLGNTGMGSHASTPGKTRHGSCGCTPGKTGMNLGTKKKKVAGQGSKIGLV